MSENNLALFHQWTDAFNRDDLDWIVEHAEEDGEFLPRRSNTEGPFRGREGMRRFWEDTRESFDVFQISLSEVHDLGDRIVGIGKIKIKGKGSGIETEIPMGAIATFRDGRLIHFMDYGDRDEALVAAGLA
jgi:ketosteroid isomerase-like protein